MKYRSVNATESAPVSVTLPRIGWDRDKPDVLRLPADYATSLKVRTTTVRPAPPPEPLRLRGSLMLDLNRLSRVRCFFSGHVISIGKNTSKQRRVGPALPADLRNDKFDDIDTLRPGDFVKKDQIVAVIWSKDIGAAKSQLVDALARLDVDQKQLDRYDRVDKRAYAQKDYDNVRHNVDADLIQISLAERTLRSYRLSEEEIAAVRREAEKLTRQIAGRGKANRKDRENRGVDAEVERTWAEAVVRAPIDGIIAEKNFNIGDVVDSTTTLFQIVDVNYLQVMVNANEEEIAALRRLPPERMRWKLRLDGADKPLEGEIDRIRPIVDPTQHTGLVTGWLPNPGGERLIGEFVNASVELPADASLVAVPATAVIEEGDSASVLVAVNGSRLDYTPRKVAVVQRGRETVLIRAQPNEVEKKRGAEPLRIGEEVITTGNLQLAAELANFKASPNGR